LTTLIDAASRLPGFPTTRLQSYLFAATAAEMVENFPLKKMRLRPDQLRELTRDELFIRLIQQRPQLCQYREADTSIGQVLQGLRILGLDRVQDEEINDTQISYAHTLDQLLDSWSYWGRHFALLSTIPLHGRRLGWTRIAYAREHLIQDSGEPYHDSPLSQIIRWGVFLYEHRLELGLKNPRPMELRAFQGNGPQAFAVEYFRSHPLEGNLAETEALFLALLQARSHLLQEYESRLRPEGETESAEGASTSPALSLRLTLQAFGEAMSQPPEGSLLAFAGTVDVILSRWRQWSDCLRILFRLPRHDRTFSRMEYAAMHLRQSDGSMFSESTLQALIRWGTFLWEHHDVLGLPEPSRGDPLFPVPPDLAIYEFYEGREIERRMAQAARRTQHEVEKVLSVFLDVRPELEAEIARNPEFAGEFAGGVSLTRMASVYLNRNQENHPNLLRAAAIVDQILERWDAWRGHFHALSRIPAASREAYIGRRLSEIPEGERRIWASFGIWLWENQETFALPGQNDPLEIASDVPPVLLDVVAEIKGLRLPKRAALFLEDRIPKVANAMLGLRRQISERGGGEVAFQTLYEWTGYYHGRSVPAFQEAMALIDDMMNHWNFWSTHLPQIVSQRDGAAADYLGKYLRGVVPNQLSHYRLLGNWIWVNREALGLRGA
jgi:hypothetical protein